MPKTIHIMKNIKFLFIAILALVASACVESEPDYKNFPSKDVDFTFAVEGNEYSTDFYYVSTLQFTNTSSKQGTVHWDFGDGSSSSEANPTHKYDKSGNYNVTLTIDGVGSRTYPILIMDIVPMDESLLVEVRVRPQDVAFLRPGQDVMIKVSAYDFSIYGGLPGKLESISADTIEDKKGDFYYLVKVRTGETAIRRNDEILPIIPGMIVVADIIIGKKTVLDYILKPVMKARQNALTER